MPTPQPDERPDVASWWSVTREEQDHLAAQRDVRVGGRRRRPGRRPQQGQLPLCDDFRE
jgi:hypothetical protein